MKFVVPLCHPDEAETLWQHGAGEVYLGYMDEEWMQNYGNHDSISRRQGKANLSRPDDLKTAAQNAQAVGLSAYLTLNGRYTTPQHNYLLRLAESWAAVGGTGLHVYDIGLMAELKKRNLPLRLSVSLLAVVQNRATVLFYKQLGADRIVFPRFLNPETMGQLLAETGLEGEAMVMGDGCPFVDGYCKGWHGVGYGDASENAEDIVYAYDTQFRKHLCQRVFPAEQPLNTCGACALEELHANGIGYGKLGGRGLPLPIRLAQLDFLIEAKKIQVSDRPQYYQRWFAGDCRCYYRQTGRSYE